MVVVGFSRRRGLSLRVRDFIDRFFNVVSLGNCGCVRRLVDLEAARAALEKSPDVEKRGTKTD